MDSATPTHAQKPVTGACGPLGASALSHVELGGTLGTGSVTIHHLNLEGLTVKAPSKRRELATPNYAQLMVLLGPGPPGPLVTRLVVEGRKTGGDIATPRPPPMGAGTARATIRSLKAATPINVQKWSMVVGAHGPMWVVAPHPVALGTKSKSGSATIQPQPMEAQNAGGPRNPPFPATTNCPVQYMVAGANGRKLGNAPNLVALEARNELEFATVPLPHMEATTAMDLSQAPCPATPILVQVRFTSVTKRTESTSTASGSKTAADREQRTLMMPSHAGNSAGQEANHLVTITSGSRKPEAPTPSNAGSSRASTLSIGMEMTKLSREPVFPQKNAITMTWVEVPDIVLEKESPGQWSVTFAARPRQIVTQ